MHKGLVASIALHAGILLWAVASFAGKDLSAPESQPIPVDLISPTELTRIKAGVKDAKEEAKASEPKPEPPKPVAKKETPPPKREQKAESEPTPQPQAKAPEPKPVEKKPEPKPEPKKVAEKKPEPPKPKPKPRPAAVEKDGDKAATKDAPKKKDNFDPDRIAALLNKAPDAGAPPRPDAPPAPKEEARGRESGQDLTMSISEIDALRARISQCWSPPVGGIGADAIRVKLRMQLAPDGTLIANPQVVNSEASPFFQAAADSAVRAVMLCQPYQLPSAKYELWRDMIINFDPRDMFRG